MGPGSRNEVQSTPFGLKYWLGRYFKARWDRQESEASRESIKSKDTSNDRPISRSLTIGIHVEQRETPIVLQEADRLV